MIEEKAVKLPAFSVCGFLRRCLCLLRWGGLSLYAINGMLNTANKLEENSSRTIALCHKIYLLAGSHASAERAAIFYSLFATCVVTNGLNHCDWLKDVLYKVAYFKTGLNRRTAFAKLAKAK